MIKLTSPVPVPRRAVPRSKAQALGADWYMTSTVSAVHNRDELDYTKASRTQLTRSGSFSDRSTIDLTKKKKRYNHA